MVATWVVGRRCEPDVLGDKLSKTAYDIVVIAMSTAIADTDPIHEYLCELARADSIPYHRSEERVTNVRTVLKQKTVRCICSTAGKQTIFIALRKATIDRAEYVGRSIRSRGLGYGIRFGTLTLSRKKLPSVSLGIIDVRSDVSQEDTIALASWAVLEKIHMLTGFFGYTGLTPTFVSDLAMSAGAISWTPMYQSIKDSSGDREYAHPSFFLFFGYCKHISVPPDATAVADTLELGDDIWNEMLPVEYMPAWDNNDAGSAFIENLGHIRMPLPDWRRWFNGCFQNCVLLDTSDPGRVTHATRLDRNRGSPGNCATKGKGNGTCKNEGNT